LTGRFQSSLATGCAVHHLLELRSAHSFSAVSDAAAHRYRADACFTVAFARNRILSRYLYPGGRQADSYRQLEAERQSSTTLRRPSTESSTHPTLRLTTLATPAAATGFEGCRRSGRSNLAFANCLVLVEVLLKIHKGNSGLVTIR